MECLPFTVIGQTSGDTIPEKDLGDLVGMLFKHHPSLPEKPAPSEAGKVYVSLLPGIGYAPTTSWQFGVSNNFSFYLDKDVESANISSVSLNPRYTLKNQFYVPVVANIWTKGNKLNLTGDWRYYLYPSYTYGLGGNTPVTNADLINYSYVRFYQTAAKEIWNNFHLGVGYDLDYHWNISEQEVPSTESDFEKYGSSSRSVSSGLSLNILYDTRKNSNNPRPGIYSNIIFRSNEKFLGSDQNWMSVVGDFRKYFRFPAHSQNIVALWSYNWITLSGTPPYLDLPATAWDTYNNTGRGYDQDRYRSPEMVYLEAEYRFRILRNGLIGGVAFGNAEGFSDWPSTRISTLHPAAGGGIRIKINKHSRINAAVDYGVGTNGSHGVFFNIGEVF